MSSHEKIALVTGATRGLGLETGRKLSKTGAKVLLGARGVKAGEAKASELRSGGLDVEAIEIDLERSETFEAAAQQIDNRFGRLDVLVNNAGILDFADGYPGAAPIDVIKHILDVNFVATVALTQKLLPLLKKSSAGRIVNLSSNLGSLAFNSNYDHPNADKKWLGYSASKAALNMFTVQLAYELRDTPIKVNAICPGYVRTDLNHGHGDLTIDEGTRAQPVYALLGPDGPSGQFFNAEGPLPW